MSNCDSSSHLLYVNSFKKIKMNDKEAKMHFNKQQQNLLKKIENLPISCSSKETLMKMIRKPVGKNQFTDIVKVLKTDKNSVTVHAKMINQENLAEDVVIKILRELQRVQDNIKVFSRNKDGSIKTESLKLFQHENVVVMRMLKNFKVLEKVLDETTNIREIFRDVLKLIHDSRDACGIFWKFNMGSSIRRIIFHENEWKILNLDQFKRKNFISKEYMAFNLVQFLDIFKLYGMRSNELEEDFMEMSKTSKYFHSGSFCYCASKPAFKLVAVMYFTKGTKDLKDFIIN